MSKQLSYAYFISLICSTLPFLIQSNVVLIFYVRRKGLGNYQYSCGLLLVSMKTAFTIFVVCLGISTGTVGNGLLYGIVLYEKFGVDSRRRTIVNMLWSQLCLTYIFSNTLGLPFAIYGYCLNDITGNSDIN